MVGSTVCAKCDQSAVPAVRAPLPGIQLATMLCVVVVVRCLSLSLEFF